MVNNLRSPRTETTNRMKAELISKAISRTQTAIKRGFHLEAVTLIESLISERLESLIEHSLGENTQTKNLGPLIKQCESLNLLSKEELQDLTYWKNDRAKIIHEMVKIRSARDANWSLRMKFAGQTAREGLVLLEKLQAITRKAKQASKLKMQIKPNSEPCKHSY